MSNMLDQPWFPWALGIAVGLPLLTLLLGEVVVRLAQRGNPLAPTLGLVRTYILPAAAILLLLTQVAGVPVDGVPTRILQTIFWMTVIIAVLSFGNALLFVGAAKNSWRSRVPHIFVDLGRLLLIGLSAVLVYQLVWGRSASGLITAIGLSSLVIGLTLQNSVGPIIAGLLLQMERPFTLGDWLKVGDVTGKVVEVNWRATHIDTGNQLQVIPNGALATATFANFSRPVIKHDETIVLRFTLQDAPNKVKQLLENVAAQVTHLQPGSTPTILLQSIEGDTVTYSTTLTLPKINEVGRARDEFLTRVYYTARRDNIHMVGLAPYLEPDQERIRAGLMRIAPLLRMQEDDWEQLVTQAQLHQYARGEVLLRQGGASSGLHFILDGQAQVVLDDAERGRLNVFELETGDYFGETALTGEPSAVTIIATTDVEELVLEGEQLQALIDRTPRLAQDLGETMEQRRRIVRSLRRPGQRLRRAPSNGRSTSIHE